MEFPKHVDLLDLKLKFKTVPVGVSFKYGWFFIQKLGACIGKVSSIFEKKDNDKEKEEFTLDEILPVIVSLTGEVVSSLSFEEINEIVNKHAPYIKVLEDDRELDLNIVYHFQEKPEGIIILIMKIFEVYYKNFFTEPPKHLINLKKLTENKEESKNQK